VGKLRGFLRKLSKMKVDPYLQNGLYLSRNEFEVRKRRKVALTVFVSAATVLSAVGLFEAHQWASKTITQAHLFPSYEQVVLGVMNGDVRMEIGNELFECKGGYLGPAR
jgi:hypothetical protein